MARASTASPSRSRTSSRGGRCCWICTGCRSRSRARAPRRGASASGTTFASSRPEASAFSLSMLDEGHHVWVQPVGAQGRVEAFLAVGTPEQPSHSWTGSSRATPSACSRSSWRSRAPSPRPSVACRATSSTSWPAGSCRRPRPRAGSRASGSRATRRCSWSRSSRSATAPTRSGSGWRPPTTARGSRAGSWSRRTPTGSTCCCRPPAIWTSPSSSRRSATASSRAPRRRRQGPRHRARSAGRPARRATRCRCAGSRAGSTPGSSSSGPTGCC